MCNRHHGPGRHVVCGETLSDHEIHPWFARFTPGGVAGSGFELASLGAGRARCASADRALSRHACRDTCSWRDGYQGRSSRGRGWKNRCTKRIGSDPHRRGEWHGLVAVHQQRHRHRGPQFGGDDRSSSGGGHAGGRLAHAAKQPSGDTVGGLGHVYPSLATQALWHHRLARPIHHRALASWRQTFRACPFHQTRHT